MDRKSDLRLSRIGSAALSSDYALVRRHFAALLEEAQGSGASLDVVGRALVDEIVRMWLETRSRDDVAAELRFVAENLGESDFEFMRP